MPIHRLPLFILLALVVSCGEQLPPFQTSPVEGSPSEVSRFAGQWYDSEGNVLIVVSNLGQPFLSIRVPGIAELLRAEYQPDGLHIWFTMDVREVEAVLRPFEPDIAWLGPPGPDARPSGCGSEFLMRNPSAIARASWFTEKAIRTGELAHRRTVDWLIDHF